MNALDHIHLGYGEEVWYSIIARWLQDWGYSNRRALLDSIFGRIRRAISLALPPQPATLLSRLHSAQPLTPAEFVRRFSLLPYYLAFEPDMGEPALAAFAAAKPRLAQRLHLDGSPLTPGVLRYCGICMHLDALRHGQPYWHRVHQLPGVEYCPQHGELLLPSSVPYAPAGLEFWAAHASRCPPPPPKARGSRNPARALLLAIARASMRLLVDQRPRHLGRVDYAELLRIAGFGATRGRIAEGKLETDLGRYLRANGQSLDRYGSPGWWRPAFTAVHHRMYPVQHIVLRHFIGTALRGKEVPLLLRERSGMFASTEDLLWAH